eukprot:1664632-Alexandrium_andersonii.AAC.1
MEIRRLAFASSTFWTSAKQVNDESCNISFAHLRAATIWASKASGMGFSSSTLAICMIHTSCLIMGSPFFLPRACDFKNPLNLASCAHE